MNTPSNYWFLLRYGLVGVSGGLIQIGTLYIWVERLHLQTYYLLGAVVGFCLALMVTFTLQKYWTFKDYAHDRAKKQFVLYTLIALMNLGLNVLLLHMSKIMIEALGLDFFHIWYLVAQVGIVGILAAISFLANYFLTFQAHRSAGTEN